MTSPELPSRIEELPLTAKATAFDYTELAAETRTTVQQNTSDIKSLMRRTSQDIVSIGQS